MPRSSTLFLAILQEIRDDIFSLVMLDDLETYAKQPTKPSLLRTCRQLREEYTHVFFGNNESLAFDAYEECGKDSTWQRVQDKTAKRAIFEEAVLRDLRDFWSVGAARRYCQDVYSIREGALRLGIMTVHAQAEIRRWRWTVAGAV